MTHLLMPVFWAIKPGEHNVQDEEFTFPEIFPEAHNSHTVWPAEEVKEPVEQSTQSEVMVAPILVA